MADEDDLEYSDSNVGLAQAQGVRKNISLKLKGKGRGRGRRGGKAKRGSSKKAAGNDENEETPETVIEMSTEKHLVDSNLDDVISKLETPAFSPMDRTFPEPLHQNKKLRWDHKVNLIGEKVIDPLIHCCEKCSLPILNYGRMIPCKHVFCYECAKKSDKLCPKITELPCFRCDEKVQRIEPSSLGTVFMCTFGGTRHSPGSCGRTYLSQRDLQAHVNHRHQKPSSIIASTSVLSHTETVTTAPSGHMPLARDPRDPRGHLQVDVSHQALMTSHLQHQTDLDHNRNPAVSLGSPAGQSRQYPHSPDSYQSAIPVSSARPNLITVPIQDDGAGHPPGAAPAHMPHPQTLVPPYIPSSAAPSHPMPNIPHPGTAYNPYPHPTPMSFSQAPLITTPTFSQPPPQIHHQPPLHQPGGASGGAPIYSTPPPNIHHQPPSTYTPPQGPAPRPPMHPPPQHHHEGGPPPYHPPPQWGTSGGVGPPVHTSLPPPRPMTAPPPNAPTPSVGLLQTPSRPPSDPSYRQPYYQ